MTDSLGKPPGEIQMIEMDECCSSNDASLIKTSNLDFFIINILVVFFVCFLINNSDKSSVLKARHRRSWKGPSP